MAKAPLSVKWTIIGAAIIIALNQILTLLLEPATREALVASMGDTGGLLMLALIVAVGSYFVGGIIIGYASPGTTLMEPAIASAIAILFNVVIWWLRSGELVNVIGVMVMIALGFALGLAGAKVGERLQGDTTDKMRERGEL